MEYKIKSITENYRERVQRLALFDCLFKLNNKKTKDNSGKYIDFFSLGLLALLFFFENMLMRNKKTGVRQLAEFFSKINEGEIDLDYKGFEAVARTIIDSFRPTGGRRNSIQFYNWETRENEAVEYSILKASKSDIKSNIQYYTLDDQGLELVFATKEYFSEFQLSINQLLLRKQLEKGEFAGALRQIDEMRIDVENLEGRIIKIKYEIQRNILSEKTYERYKNLVEDINIRLKREGEEFDELKDFTDETRKALAYEIKNEKDIKAYKYIVEIQKELGEVHRLHRNLLHKSLELKNTTLQSAQESLYYVGIDSFNFKQEIVSRLFASPLPLQSSKTLIRPLLYLERNIAWSPITVFDRQRIVGRDGEEGTDEFLAMKDEDIIKKELEIQQKNFRYIIEIVLKVLKRDVETTIEEIVDYMMENDERHILDSILFYHFFIILHQKSPLILNEENYEKETVLQGVIETLYGTYSILTVTEMKGTVRCNDRFSIRNMKIKLEEKTDGLQQ